MQSGCINISELQLIGNEVLNSEEEAYDCPVNITQADGDTKNLTDTVRYAVSLTPVITAVSPRWGSVEGGTPITFTGSNLSEDINDYSIYIDGIECLVSDASETSVACTT